MTWQIPTEDMYNGPRPDCLHPEWWHSENNMATEQELAQLVAAFVRAMQPEFVLEVGAHYGQTSELIGKALQQNKHGRLITLEITPDMANVARARCEWVKDVVEVVTINSLEYTPPETIDLLFIDGQEQRVLDLERFLPYCKTGAVILMHDMMHPTYSVQLPRIYELCPDHILLDTPRGMVVLTNGSVV